MMTVSKKKIFSPTLFLSFLLNFLVSLPLVWISNLDTCPHSMMCRKRTKSSFEGNEKGDL